MRKKTKPEFAPEIEDLIRDDRIKHSTALFLQGLPEPERAPLFRLFRDFHYGQNKQRELVEWLGDLRGRDHATTDNILSRAGLDEIVSDILLNGPQKADRLRDRLFALRFPAVSRYLSDLARKVDGLPLPEGVRLVPVSPLEDNEYRLEIRFRSVTELRERLAALGQSRVAEGFKELETFLERSPAASSV